MKSPWVYGCPACHAHDLDRVLPANMADFSQGSRTSQQSSSCPYVILSLIIRVYSTSIFKVFSSWMVLDFVSSSWMVLDSLSILPLPRRPHLRTHRLPLLHYACQGLVLRTTISPNWSKSSVFVAQWSDWTFLVFLACFHIINCTWSLPFPLLHSLSISVFIFVSSSVFPHVRTRMIIFFLFFTSLCLRTRIV